MNKRAICIDSLTYREEEQINSAQQTPKRDAPSSSSEIKKI